MNDEAQQGGAAKHQGYVADGEPRLELLYSGLGGAKILGHLDPPTIGVMALQASHHLERLSYSRRRLRSG